ncbi:MAG: hypothetical protein VX028_02670 [Nanoarchaeota archaeon]|nr:hypothetical protein [Nanoarchaeota archaeon]
MSFLGFLIEREYSKPLVIFTEKKELSSIQIVGFDRTLPKEFESIFLDAVGNKKDFILLNPNEYVYSKISLGEKKVVDYDYRVFWFHATSYKILRDLFYVREVNQGDYSFRFVEILGYF